MAIQDRVGHWHDERGRFVGFGGHLASVRLGGGHHRAPLADVAAKLAGRPSGGPRTGQAALDASPARLVDDGLGPGHPEHVRGEVTWSGGNPGWSAGKREEIITALENYRGSDFSPINKSLRGIEPRPLSQSDVDMGREAFHARLAGLVSQLDEVMAHSRLAHDVEVSRGSGSGAGIFGDALQGDLTGFEWTERAFTSTTANPKIASDFSYTGLTMTVHVPAGTGVVNLSPMKTSSGGDDEAELLFERGLRFRVVKDSGPPAPGTYDGRQLVVEVVRG